MELALINKEEEALAAKALEFAANSGASACRVCLNKSLMDLTGTLDGELDKVSHCLDRSLAINIFADGRYGSFSTNRLEEEELRLFIDKAVSTVRMLACDECRTLPDRERKAKDAVSGVELGLYDSAYQSMDSDQRVSIAIAATAKARGIETESEEWRLVSEEGEYSDSCFDSITMDSEGLYARHTETSFEYGVEVTVEDKEGNKYSGYWWDAAPFKDKLDWQSCSSIAIRRAVAQMGAKEIESRKCKVVVDSEVASRLLTPVLNALGGFSLQQNNSFMQDRLGQKVFHEGVTIIDECRQKGETGCRLFDSEGVATQRSSIVESGVLKQYFINTYISHKTGMTPTIEDVTRAKVMPWPEEGLRRDDLMRLCGEGILVTGFNGGNSNAATGDFSFGIEGFAFENGKITHPVSELLMTGNFITLWNNFLAAGSDARACMSRLVPSLAFDKVDISA